MRTIEVKLYKFSELSEEAQQKAIDSLYDINVFFDWWDSTYEDAERAGIKITGFDIDRGNYCEGEFIEGPEHTAHKIIDDHGQDCETYKTAEQYLKERDELINTAQKDEDGEFTDEHELDNKLDDLDAEFLKSILEDYRIILSKEWDYLTSKEAIIETIEANDYEFTEDGKKA